MAAVLRDGHALRYVSIFTSDYKEIAMMAVARDAWALQHVRENRDDYKEIALAAVAKDVPETHLVSDFYNPYSSYVKYNTLVKKCSLRLHAFRSATKNVQRCQVYCHRASLTIQHRAARAATTISCSVANVACVMIALVQFAKSTWLILNLMAFRISCPNRVNTNFTAVAYLRGFKSR
jgi:hypothetical protein